MPTPIRDGDILPMIGGPCDGGECRIDGLLCHELDLYGHHYELDEKRRAYVYTGFKKQEMNS